MATKAICPDLSHVSVTPCRVKILRRLIGKSIEKVDLFDGLPEPFVDALCNELEHVYFVEGDLVLMKGELSDRMFIIQQVSPKAAALYPTQRTIRVTRARRSTAVLSCV